jgi:deoxyribonuclease-4
VAVLIGAHISVSGGYEKALHYVLSVGGECAQVFAKSPRQWRGPAIDPDAAARFADARKRVAFGPVYTHAAYLLNLATYDDVLWERSVAALADELARGAALQANGVVTHVGSDPLRDPDRAASRVAEAICRAFEGCAEQGLHARLLLENTAGTGNSFGSTFEQLGSVIGQTGLGCESLGMCLDTCHAQAFGIPIDSEGAWECLLDSADHELGLERLGVIHANDCMFGFGEHRDRHEWIGDGTIGLEGFSAMFAVIGRVSELDDLCAITELAGDIPHKDEENLRRLNALRDAVAA